VRWAAGAVLLLPSAAFGAGEVVPRPEGWLGTGEQWTQGLGIALALLALVLMGIAWWRLRSGARVRNVIGMLAVGLAVLPVVVIFFGYMQGLQGMETVEACGGCHVMTGHVADLRDVKSESLAAVHFKNRFILEHQCYTCHSDYGMFGTLSAKAEGVGHVLRYVTGSYTLPIKIRHPYPNVRCLGCHAESQRFLNSSGHPADIKPQLMSNELSCLSCHAPAHTPKEARQ
jgi:nitrate/TMAO reductase-like tetraheme cytochrome c subunit